MSLVKKAATCFAIYCRFPNSQSEQAVKFGAQQRRHALLRELVVQFEKLTQASPVLLVFEDVHWIDPTTQELLNMLVDEVATSRALILITTRPGYESPWFGQPHVGVFSLNRPHRSRVPRNDWRCHRWASPAPILNAPNC